jgi:integrase
VNRRTFGSVRKRASEHWQASYWKDGVRHTAPTMFSTKADAIAYLSAIETDIRRGAWIDPRFGRVSFAEYAEIWLASRTDIRPRTVEQYHGLLTRILVPAFGRTELAKLRPSAVRVWYGQLSGKHPATASNAYRLLRAIYNTAVRDELVASSPCRIMGAGSDRSPERPMLSVAQVEALTEATTECLRAAVVLASWGGLRRGEILGLQRKDVNEVTGGVAVERTLHELHTGEVVYGPPKSAAGARFVHLPKPAMAIVLAHLEAHVAPRADAPLFVSTAGNALRPRFLEAEWRRARKAVGLGNIRFHDLRHFHLTLFATQGATTAELMARAGHSSPKAALTYQHATSDRDKVLADALADFVAPAEVVPLNEPANKRSRPDRAHQRRTLRAHLLSAGETCPRQESNPQPGGCGEHDLGTWADGPKVPFTWASIITRLSPRATDCHVLRARSRTIAHEPSQSRGVIERLHRGGRWCSCSGGGLTMVCRLAQPHRVTRDVDTLVRGTRRYRDDGHPSAPVGVDAPCANRAGFRQSPYGGRVGKVHYQRADMCVCLVTLHDLHLQRRTSLRRTAWVGSQTPTCGDRHRMMVLQRQERPARR